MAKLWSSLSVVLVLAMMLFLVPAVMLVPNVAAAEDVVQEVEATFAFNETEFGDWWPFTAGLNTIQAPGLCLAQFTRSNVLRGMTDPLPGCGFRNYTVGSGAVTGGGLDGALSLSWLTFNFSQKYNLTPLHEDYGEFAHFGWMAGRGHIGSDLTFVYVLDFDSDAELYNATGKGFMLSVEESGAFAGHKIIGDFEIYKTGASYTGNFHLRNYAPNEVYDTGVLNVTGGVKQEVTDPIHAPLALLNFTQDGPHPTATNITTDFEEIAWGKDPVKTVTSGHLGTNGAMDVSRNTALYMELLGTHVRIQGTTVNTVYIDDTDTGIRHGDGSPYGELWELLVLYIPDQDLILGANFTQSGYTITPFGTVNGQPSGTECYAGVESYADAVILIEASLVDAKQYSVDDTFGLCPHPKVLNVTPNTGNRGQTMNVTIKGKYFLRADGEKSGWVANAGSLSFGEGITVNNYTIMNSSPIDNEIEANITISSCAAGPRPVSVTSCFGYQSGSGIAPYKTGALAGAFDVPVAGTACLEGHVDLSESRGAPGSDGWIETYEVHLFQYGGAELACSPVNATTNNTGVFFVYGIPPGTYNISIKNFTSLRAVKLGETLLVDVCNPVNFGVIWEGDADNNNYIMITDLGCLLLAWNAGTTSPDYRWYYDMDRNGYCMITDLGVMLLHWNKQGAPALT